MSQLNIQFFASLREQLGHEQITIDWPNADSANTLIETIAGKLGPNASHILSQPDILVAVNQTMVDKDHQIEPGDEVAFLPPVTGG